VGGEYPVKQLPTSDEFDGTTLGMQWGWNHNPDPEKWSLTDQPGFLRLRTAKVVPGLKEARNTLTQRIFANYDQSVPTTGTAKMNVEKMQDGDVAGLAVFQDPYAYIGIRQQDGKKQIIMVNNGETIAEAPLAEGSTVYLRAVASNKTKRAHFLYSLDGNAFTPLGDELAMQFNLSVFTGNKFCLFNYATSALGGYVDVDWFRMK
jgi:beta-xylosidase